jgi:petrobactin synthase
MIKVHCFVSCVCEAVKKTDGTDHRPYYFGVWDADFDVLENGILTYHSKRIDHDFFHQWYEMLYGIKLDKWYDDTRSKQENIKEMMRLIESKNSHQYLMVMLDLSKLPERENKFHQSPFPHYVMLETTENEEEWFMYDPDFRWEGVLPKEQILAAIEDPSVEGGYFFDASNIIPPSAETVEAYFNTCIKHDCNPMTDAVADIIKRYTSGDEKYPLTGLTLALRELPVLAIRKYAYEHAFAFFWESLGYDEPLFENWCDEIEQLVKGYTAIQYRAMKIAITGNLSLKEEIFVKLEEQNVLEFKIKQGLQESFEAWSKLKNPQKTEEVTL